ncbi:MAG TPA: tetratricopeptide repeat-containing glycosyltransferase family protein [Humisphaera sp.]|nr:tetratricopeptide repeat-containing glycosyltransferase family protein [Humisphaera sp.]
MTNPPIDKTAQLLTQYSNEERFAEALQILKTLRGRLPEHVLAYNEGLLCHRMCNLSEAIRLFERSIKLEPNAPMVHWTYSLALLTSGNLRRGWEEFEWRLKAAELRLGRTFPKPQWTGREDLAGKTILLHTEGGFGDAFHFLRYVPMVLARGARVLLECEPSLFPLFNAYPGVASTHVRGSALPEFDYFSALQSLPRAFETTLRTIPATVPYLWAPPALVESWRDKLGPPRGLRVGLSWCGSAIAWPKRSRTLATFAPLAKVQNVEFHSLQIGAEAAEPRPPGMEVADHARDLSDFAQTAALASSMDLIISVDTSITHLGGALGKPVWVILPKDPDFRWLMDRTDSPWYPKTRLFRQARKSTGWEEVVGVIASELQKAASQLNAGIGAV